RLEVVRPQHDDDEREGRVDLDPLFDADQPESGADPSWPRDRLTGALPGRVPGDRPERLALDGGGHTVPGSLRRDLHPPLVAGLRLVPPEPLLGGELPRLRVERPGHLPVPVLPPGPDRLVAGLRPVEPLLPEVPAGPRVVVSLDVDDVRVLK